MGRIKIAPSLLAADFARLKDEIQKVEAGGADLLHLDVMDGHFVPNLTIGPVVVEWVRKVTKLPLDCHLMVMEPEKHVEAFAQAGADSVTFHAEAVAQDYARVWKGRGWAMTMPCKTFFVDRRVEQAVNILRKHGKRVGLAVNPDTEIEAAAELLPKVDMVLAMTVWPGFGGQAFIDSVVPKVEKLRRMAETLDIEVDGGLNPETVKRAAAAGANVIVAGTATFRSEDVPGAIRALRENAEGALRARV
jgi:ribulose-phosphate 3-epimerase